MEKPKIKALTPEAYNELKMYAQYLSNKLTVEGPEMSGTELGRLKANVKFAWRDTHEMAIDVSQNFGNRAKEALNNVMLII